MRRLALFCFFFIACATFTLAQFTTVSGTVTDPNGLPYAYGTITPIIVSSGTPKFTATGLTYLPPSQASGLDATGTFRVTLADVTALTPGGATWTFVVCSGLGTVQPAFGKGPVCFTVAGVSVSGAAQSITATLTAAAPALTVNFGGGVTCSGCSLNTIPVWNGSALVNSPITSNGLSSIAFGGGLSPLNQGNAILSTFNLASSGSCSGSNTIPLPAWGCEGVLANNVVKSTGASATVDNFSSIASLASFSNNGTLLTTGYFSIQGNPSASFTEERNLYIETDSLEGPTTRRGIYVFTGGFSAATSTTTTQEGIVIDNRLGSSFQTITNDYGLHILSPNLTGGGILTNHVGLQIDDQTGAGGGTNSNPKGIVINGGGLQLGGHTFSTLPTCNAGQQGRIEQVTDSTTVTWGATITGTGASVVLAFCDGAAWTVAAK